MSSDGSLPCYSCSLEKEGKDCVDFPGSNRTSQMSALNSSVVHFVKLCSAIMSSQKRIYNVEGNQPARCRVKIFFRFSLADIGKVL